MQFIYLIIDLLPWDIHTSGQYLNRDSINALKTIRLFLKGTNLAKDT